MKKNLVSIVAMALVVLSVMGNAKATYVEYVKENLDGVNFRETYDIDHPVDAGYWNVWLEDAYWPYFGEACDYIRENYNLENEWFVINDGEHEYVFKFVNDNHCGYSDGYFEEMRFIEIATGNIDWQWQEGNLHWIAG